jgi:demethylmenaquinone methyltransferase / 2-methoxy-6-polyprenyl-1,4-benzoquinol methylase
MSEVSPLPERRATDGPESQDVHSRLPARRFVDDLFSSLAPRYGAALLAFSLGQDLRWKHTLIRGIRTHQGERSLDLATGTGLLYDRLVRRLGEGSVTGLDLNRRMLVGARANSPNRRIIQADAERLPFRAGSFDILTSGFLFKYVDVPRFLAESRRVLRPGGRIAGYDFSRPQRHRSIGQLYSVYLHKLLPWLGRRAHRGRMDWVELFDFLSEIAESSGWEDRIARTLHSTGFRDVRQSSSLGGAITWVWARLPRENERAA